MKKHKLLIMFTFITIIAISVLTGCDAHDKLELLNALEKNAGMDSWENSSQVRFTGVAFDTNIEGLLPLQLFVPMLDNVSLQVNQKVKQSTDKSRIKMQSDISIVSDWLSEQTTMWFDYDLGQQPISAKQIVKLPSGFAEGLPEDLAGKEYFILDQKDLPAGEQLNPHEYTEMLETMKDFQSQLLQLIKTHALRDEPGFVVVRQLKDQTVNGQKMSLYQLKLDDKAFKTVLKYALSIFAENEQAKNLIRDFVLMAGSLAEGTEAGQDIQMAYAALTDGEAPFKDETDLVMAALENVTMLGGRGIEMNFLINRDGYIVNQNGVLDLHIDSQQIEDAFEKLAGDIGYDGKETYNFTFAVALEFNSDTSSINQDIRIDFPVLTRENSFDFNDFAGIAPSFGRSMLSMDNRTIPLDFSRCSPEEVLPVKLGNRTFVPLEAISKKLSFSLDIRKNDEFTLTAGNKEVKGKVGSSEILLDGKRQYLPIPVMKIENRLFVSDQFMKLCLNKEIYFDEKSKLLIIQKN